MARRVDEIVRGPIKSKTVFPALILHLIERQPDHGYGLMQRIEAICGDLVAVNTNKIYPLLRRLEERGFVSASWDHPTKRSRRIYAITESGRERLRRINRFDAAVSRFDRRRDRTLQVRALRTKRLVFERTLMAARQDAPSAGAIFRVRIGGYRIAVDCSRWFCLPERFCLLRRVQRSQAAPAHSGRRRRTPSRITRSSSAGGRSPIRREPARSRCATAKISRPRASSTRRIRSTGRSVEARRSRSSITAARAARRCGCAWARSARFA